MNNQLSSSLPAIQGAEITDRTIDDEEENRLIFQHFSSISSFWIFLKVLWFKDKISNWSLEALHLEVNSQAYVYIHFFFLADAAVSLYAYYLFIRLRKNYMIKRGFNIFSTFNK